MADNTKVTRIKAKDETAPKKTTRVKATPVKKSKKTASKRKFSFTAPKWLKAIGKPFAPAGRYFKGAWQELKLVRWPNRQATWGLTVAVIAFSLFFLLLIVLLDSAFKALFEFIIT